MTTQRSLRTCRISGAPRALRTGHLPGALRSQRAQASLETVFAIWGALLLVFGSFVIMRWMVDRLVTRQVEYDESRVAAAAWSYHTTRPQPPPESVAAWDWEH